MMLGSLFRKRSNPLNNGSKQIPSPSNSVQVHAEACEAPPRAFQAHNTDAPMNCAAEDRCGMVYDVVMEMHLRETHAEHPNRVRELNSKLEKEGLLANCQKIVSKLASTKELLKCHTQAHIDKVEQLYNNPVNEKGEPAKQEGDTFIISGDIYCNKHTSTAARSAAGCSIQAVNAVLSGEVHTAFAIVRPPGHHAEANEVQGFCFYNNVAVAAHAALSHPGIERVLIVDWDIHHGNGTQKIFEDDPRVLFVSLHRRDKEFYPEGVGYAEEVGTGAGQGFNVNIPWTSDGRAMLVGDADYLAAFDLILDPIFSQYNPQLVLISAGFDAAHGDILGKCHVSPAGFAAMTQRLRRYADGKVVAVLEGGYVPSIVGECAAAVMKVLQGAEPQPVPQATGFKAHSNLCKVLTKVNDIHCQYWSGLAALPPFATRFKEYSSTMSMQGLTLGGQSSPCRATRAATRAAAAGTGAIPIGEQAEAPKSLATPFSSLKKTATAKDRSDKRAVAAAERQAAAAAKASLSSYALMDIAADSAAAAELTGVAAPDATTSAAAAVQDDPAGAAAADHLADAISSLSVNEPSRSGSNTGEVVATKADTAKPTAVPAACIKDVPVIIAGSDACTSVAPISAVPFALQRAATENARAEQRAKAAAERKALAERRAAAQAAKLARIQEKRKAEVAAARAAAMAAAEAEEAAAAAAEAAGNAVAPPQVAVAMEVTVAPPASQNREDRVCAAALIVKQPSSSSLTEESSRSTAATGSSSGAEALDTAEVTPGPKQQPDAAAQKVEAAALLTSTMPPTPPSAVQKEAQLTTPAKALMAI